MMKTKYNLITIKLLFFSIILFSCNTPKSYKYEEGVLRYLHEIHNLDTKLDVNVILLALNDCSLCLDISLDKLNNQKNKIDYLVLIGKIEPQTQKQVEEAIKKYNILTDVESEFKKYETNYDGPIMFVIKDENIIDYESLK